MELQAITQANYRYFRHVSFLIVEPSPFMRRTIVSMLRLFGCENYKEASDGAEALKLMQAWRPDIILTEYAMAPLDGIEMTRLIRADGTLGLHFIPVIMVTSYTEVWRVSEARDAGVNEFVVKPFSAKTLVRRIFEVIDRPRQFVKTPHYFGPDRRRKQVDLKDEATDRRSETA